MQKKDSMGEPLPYIKRYSQYYVEWKKVTGQYRFAPKQTNKKKLCMYVHIVYTQRKLEENICMVISGAWWYVFLFSSFSLSDLSMQETYALLI